MSEANNLEESARCPSCYTRGFTRIGKFSDIANTPNLSFSPEVLSEGKEVTCTHCRTKYILKRRE